MVIIKNCFVCCYIAYALIFCGTQAYTLRDDISVVPGVLVGQSTRNDDVFSTGVTTVLCPGSCNAAAAQLGGAPCTAQTDPLSLSNLGTNSIAGVVLTGGSILGLYGSSDGVVSCVANATREQFPGQLVLSGFSLPQIPSAALLDLLYQNLKTHGASAAFQHKLREEYFLLGSEACNKAMAQANGQKNPVAQGSTGAGTGALVGYYCDFNVSRTTKGGTGSAAVELPNGVFVGALVVANVFGAINAAGGGLIGGCLDDSGKVIEPERQLEAGFVTESYTNKQNTALGVVATNVPLSKQQLHRLAISTSFGLSDAVSPAATAFDGDIIFALSTGLWDGQKQPTLSILEMAARDAMTHAVRRAVCCVKQDTTVKVAKDVSRHLCQQVLNNFENGSGCEALEDYLTVPTENI